ncbi:hypothetical protein K505DRAFT_329319 [Melanomma pulvis-pyrius CBS 109.77]|uniref:Uncharacterized protein n=1 Tax=Melanomma pulvis-pyrius CBS 109.77 TaxID=1314802 RepID=A0A6A6WUM6_9PLEO|nr:hypothetical protein K505DRAFT_329319 [Melanomma pulvis-pyrius CBS 109.77]
MCKPPGADLDTSPANIQDGVLGSFASFPFCLLACMLAFADVRFDLSNGELICTPRLLECTRESLGPWCRRARQVLV